MKLFFALLITTGLSSQAQAQSKTIFDLSGESYSGCGYSHFFDPSTDEYTLESEVVSARIADGRISLRIVFMNQFDERAYVSDYRWTYKKSLHSWEVFSQSGKSLGFMIENKMKLKFSAEDGGSGLTLAVVGDHHILLETWERDDDDKETTSTLMALSEDGSLPQCF